MCVRAHAHTRVRFCQLQEKAEIKDRLARRCGEVSLRKRELSALTAQHDNTVKHLQSLRAEVHDARKQLTAFANERRTCTAALEATRGDVAG